MQTTITEEHRGLMESCVKWCNNEHLKRNFSKMLCPKHITNSLQVFLMRYGAQENRTDKRSQRPLTTISSSFRPSGHLCWHFKKFPPAVPAISCQKNVMDGQQKNISPLATVMGILIQRTLSPSLHYVSPSHWFSCEEHTAQSYKIVALRQSFKRESQ